MARGAVGRRSPTCSAIMVPWLKPTKATAEGGGQRGGRLVDADPALLGVPKSEGEPLPPARRLAAWLRRVRGYEGAMGHERLPGAADLDQVLAVGPIAVQEHHQLPRRAARLRLPPRATEVT